MIGRWSVMLETASGTEFASALTYFDVASRVYDVSITVVGLPATVSVSLFVDGQYQGPVTEDETRTLSFKLDTAHSIAIPQSIESFGNLYFASQNTWNVGSAGSHTFVYSTQVTFTSTPTSSTSATTTQACYVHITGAEGTEPLQGPAPLTVKFSIGVSGYGAGYTVDWSFGDGTSQHFENGPAGISTVHTYEVSGTYQATVVANQGVCHDNWQWTIVVSSVSTSITTEPPGGGPTTWWLIVLIISSAIAFPVLTVSVVAVARIRRSTTHPPKERTNSWGSITAIAFGGMLLVASLWQLEIVEIGMRTSECSYYWPFGLGGPTCWWMARDFWFVGVFTAFVLALLGASRLASYTRQRSLIQVYSQPSGPQTPLIGIDERLYTYIALHGGTISRSAASKDLHVPLTEIDASIERLKRVGRIA